MNNSLNFEAEPFELSSPESAGEQELGSPSRTARPGMSKRIAPGGGRFQRGVAEREVRDFEVEGLESIRTIPPGGGRFDREREMLDQEAPGVPGVAIQQCVPAPPILTTASAIARARTHNSQTARSLLWGNLV